MSIATDLFQITEVVPGSANIASVPGQVNSTITLRYGPDRCWLYTVTKASATTSGDLYLPNINRINQVNVLCSAGTATTPSISANTAKVVTITLTSTGFAAGETITFNSDNSTTGFPAKVTLTCVSSGAVAANGEFNVGANVTAQASSIVSAINAQIGKIGIATATSSSGVVTLTATAGRNFDVTSTVSANVAIATTTQGAYTSDANSRVVRFASLPSGITTFHLFVVGSAQSS